MKRGKEFKIEEYDNNYNTVYGTVDHKDPKSVYIKISSWGQPKSEDEIAYDRVIKNLHKKIKKLTHLNIDGDVFTDNCIVDLDMRESGIRYNKRSFMDCEIILFQSQTELLPITSDELREAISNISSKLLNELNSSEYFSFHKMKK